MSTDKQPVSSTYLYPAEKALNESVRFYIDYTADFADVDPVDSIASSTWVIDGSVTEVASGYTDNLSWIKPAGGTKIGTLHRLTNSIVTAQGDTIVRLLTIKIVNIHVKRPNEEDVNFVTPTPL